jgi:hypothetical protein
MSLFLFLFPCGFLNVGLELVLDFITILVFLAYNKLACQTDCVWHLALYFLPVSHRRSQGPATLGSGPGSHGNSRGGRGEGGVYAGSSAGARRT